MKKIILVILLAVGFVRQVSAYPCEREGSSSGKKHVTKNQCRCGCVWGRSSYNWMVGNCAPCV